MLPAQSGETISELADALTLAATFDRGTQADQAKGDGRLYIAPTYGTVDEGKPSSLPAHVKIVEQEGLFGSGLRFERKEDPVLFYLAKDNISYNKQHWSGTISLWLRVDPEKELAPGYTDPIQITDEGYNDAALWVDFSNANPRSFRMGVFGDLAVWNPDNIGPDVNPDFISRLLTAADRPFSADRWTHVVISFEGLNSQQGTAQFYINGKWQGDRGIPEPFSWELERAKIYLGLNYVGWLDEVSIFDQALTADQVNTLYQLPTGLKDLLR